MFPLILAVIVIGGVAYVASQSEKGGATPASKLPKDTVLDHDQTAEFEIEGYVFEWETDTGVVWVIEPEPVTKIGSANVIQDAYAVASTWLDSNRPVIVDEPPAAGMLYEVWLDAEGRMWNDEGVEVDQVVELDVCAGDRLVIHYPDGMGLSLLREQTNDKEPEVIASPIPNEWDEDSQTWAAAWDLLGYDGDPGADRWFVGLEYMNPETYEVEQQWGFWVTAELEC